MNCIYCNHDGTKVTNSRGTDKGKTWRRRRECLSCGERFTTHEEVREDKEEALTINAEINLMRFETYDREYQKRIIDLGMTVADFAWHRMPKSGAIVEKEGEDL